MSEPDRDDVVSRRYRELPREEPPGALDAEILAAARGEQELRMAPLVAPTGRRRWYVPVAAAAVIMLSVAVTLHLLGERPDPELVSGEEVLASPAPAPAAAAASGAAESAKLAQDAPAPEEWLARIARLRGDGRHAEADQEYAAFRRRYPDFRIPEALQRQVLPR